MRKMFDYLVLPLLACGLGYGAYELTRSRNGPPRPEGTLAQKKSTCCPGTCPPRLYPGEIVALNRGPDVGDGFRGEVHPLLHGRTQLTLTAHWVPVGNGQYVSQYLRPAERQLIQGLKAANQQQTYSARDFSGFLPDKLASPGQVWSLEPTRVVHLLRQFHHSPSLHLVAKGRRAGPDGAFAVLRAVSTSHLDIAFRIHAEFDITPETPTGDFPVEKIWYTPAYFSGQMIVNRESGIVEHFRMGLPTDKTLNAHFTVGVPGGDAHDIVRVDGMELSSGASELAAKEVAWNESITHAAAQERLQRVFYKFMEIKWLPFDQVMTAARDANKPIFAMVLWGALDDQSC